MTGPAETVSGVGALAQAKGSAPAKPIDFLRGTWTIVTYTFQEGWRRKTIIAFLFLSILLIFGANFMTSFLSQKTVGDAEVDIDVKLIKDISVTTISIFGVLITIFISASVIPNEVENRVIYTVLSKPIRRFQYLLGKFIGAQLIVILNLALMGALFMITVYAKQRVFPSLLVYSLVLTYFEFLIVSALTFAVSCAATSPVLPTIAGLFVYITGNLTEYLKDVYNRAGQTDLWVDAWIGRISLFLYWLLPNLKAFSLKFQILNLAPNDPPRDVQFLNLIGYSLLFVVSGYIMAYWIFRRKEL